MGVLFSSIVEAEVYDDAAALAAVDTANYENGSLAQINSLGLYKLDKDSIETVDNTNVIDALNSGRWLKDNQPGVLFLGDTNILNPCMLPTLSGLNPGSATAPTIAPETDKNTGMYFPATDTIGFSTNGTLRFSISTTALTSTLPIVAPAGTVSAPSYAFTGELDCGLYLIGSGNVGLSINGANLLSFAAANVTFADSAAIVTGGRFQLKKGSDIASEQDITAPADGNAFNVTGTTTIVSLEGLNWQIGSIIVLEFTANVTVTHNGSASGTALPLFLAGAANLSAQSGDTLMLMRSGTVWVQVGGSVNHA